MILPFHIQILTSQIKIIQSTTQQSPFLAKNGKIFASSARFPINHQTFDIGNVQFTAHLSKIFDRKKQNFCASGPRYVDGIFEKKYWTVIFGGAPQPRGLRAVPE